MGYIAAGKVLDRTWTKGGTMVLAQTSILMPEQGSLTKCSELEVCQNHGTVISYHPNAMYLTDP